MPGFQHHDITHLLRVYGYGAIFLFVGLENLGFPLPGETILLAAAIYAGTHPGPHSLDLWLIILAAWAGTVSGGSAGYWLGREFGYELLLRYGSFIRFDQKRMKLGQYLFLRHGGKVVFFGRFVAVLRAFAALLAGINCMDWRRFFVFNMAGGLAWAALYAGAGFTFSKAVHRLLGTVGLIALAVAAEALIAGILLLRRHEAALQEAAEKAIPGPLAHHLGGRQG